MLATKRDTLQATELLDRIDMQTKLSNQYLQQQAHFLGNMLTGMSSPHDISVALLRSASSFCEKVVVADDSGYIWLFSSQIGQGVITFKGSLISEERVGLQLDLECQLVSNSSLAMPSMMLRDRALRWSQHLLHLGMIRRNLELTMLKGAHNLLVQFFMRKRRHVGAVHQTRNRGFNLVFACPSVRLEISKSKEAIDIPLTRQFGLDPYEVVAYFAHLRACLLADNGQTFAKAVENAGENCSWDWEGFISMNVIEPCHNCRFDRCMLDVKAKNGIWILNLCSVVR